MGTYSIPKEFKDEDKWFRFFTKKQLIYAGVGVAMVIGVMTVSKALGVTGVGICISEVIVLADGIIAFITMPTERYLIGGGYPLSTIVLRLVRKKLPSNKVLYIKHYDKDDEEVVK